MWNSVVAGPVGVMVALSSFTVTVLPSLVKVHLAASVAVPAPVVSIEA
jgi:hypothetical protein